MNKKLILLLFLGMVLISFASATCTVSFDKDNYIASETVTATIVCDSATEKSDSYRLNWTNETGYIFESDTGTTPATVGESFFESYTIPSDWPDGVFINASLEGTDNSDLEGLDYANVSSAGGSGALIVTNVTITPYSELFLGKNFGISFFVFDENNKKISNAGCKVDLESGDGVPIISDRDVSHDGRGQINFVLGADAFDEGRSYRARVGCYCGGTGTSLACIDEDGTEVTNSIGTGSDSFSTNTWLNVNTVTGKSLYYMKEEMFICANVSNLNYDSRIAIEIAHEARCSSGTDNNDDLDRALIISDYLSPDLRGISVNSTQMQCKRFVVPEATYLQGKSSECYASTDVVVIDEDGSRVMSYHTTSPPFNITSDELNLYPDWERISDYTFNSIINLSDPQFTDYNGVGTGNIDIKLYSVLSRLDTEKQQEVEGINFDHLIASEYIKNITASNGSTLTPYLEYLEDGSLEIELRDVDISPNGWYNVTLYLNSFGERQTEALEGINNKTGTFHLSVECPSEGLIGDNINCSITAQVEDSQIVQKEVDFTCAISDGVNEYSSLNFNQMVTRSPVTLYRSFSVLSNFTDGQSLVLQCYADYYNLGLRRDSFYDSFTSVSSLGSGSGGTEGITGRGSITGDASLELPDDSGSGEGDDNDEGEEDSEGSGFFDISEKSWNSVLKILSYIAIALFLIVILGALRRKAFEKNNHFLKVLFLALVIVGAIGLIYFASVILQGSLEFGKEFFQDKLVRGIIVTIFVVFVISFLFRVLNVRGEIKFGHQDYMRLYDRKYKEQDEINKEILRRELRDLKKDKRYKIVKLKNKF